MTCSWCNGEGVKTVREAHPWGSTFAYEELSEPCPDCYEQGICPDCGEADAFVAERDAGPYGEKCKACGWYYDPI